MRLGTGHEIMPAMDMIRSGDVVLTGMRAEPARVGRRLQYLTMAWNSAEAVVALTAGFFAGSIALAGFGFDSVIEVTSSVAAFWRLGHDSDEVKRELAERRFLRIIGTCFLILAAYVLYESTAGLIGGKAPHRSIVGIIVAALSLIVMPLLVRYKRRIARRLASGALEAEARQTRVCAYLSAILLVGLGLNAWWGWWWADPLAGLGMVPRRPVEGALSHGSDRRASGRIEVVTPFPGQQIAGTSSPIPNVPGYSHINSQRTLRHRRLRESIGVGVEPVR
jgi:Cation efflux family